MSTRKKVVIGIVVAAVLIAIIFLCIYIHKRKHPATKPPPPADPTTPAVGLAQRRPFRDVNRMDGHSIGLDGVVRDVLALHESATNQYALFLRGEWGSPSFLQFRALASDMLAKSRTHGGKYPKSILEVLDAIMVRIDNDPTQLSVPDSDAWKTFHGQLHDLMDRCSKYLESHMQIGITVGSDGRGQMSTAADSISQHLSKMEHMSEEATGDPDSQAMLIETSEMNMLEEMDYIDSKLVDENPELSSKSAARYKEVESRRTGKGLFPRARQGGYIPETAAEVTQTLYDIDTRRTPIGRIPGGASTAYDVESSFVRFPLNSVNRSIYGPQF